MKASAPKLVVACLLGLIPAATGADWPQFRGPDRDNVSKETGLLKSWPKEGPPLLWTYADAGAGYSGPAIVGDRLYAMGARGDSEYIFALDLKATPERTVKELWAAKVGRTFTWKGNNWNTGPSATPAVDGDLVYGLGGQGILLCVESATGKERWRKDMAAELGGEVNNIGGSPDKIGWGYNWSPLVDGDQLVCVPGGKQGTLAALNKKTGEVLWRSTQLTDQASYSSPVLADVGGMRHYVILTNDGLSGVNAKDGRLLWRYHKEYPDVVIPTPLVHENEIYATAGYGAGCDLVKLAAESEKFKATKVYANKVMVNQQGGVVLVEGHVYGYSEGKGWICQDFAKGKQTWMQKRLGRGSLTCADGRLYCYTEDEGGVALVEAVATSWKEHGRFEIPQKSKLRRISGKVWTHPVVAGGRLYLRDQNLIFCFDVQDHDSATH